MKRPHIGIIDYGCGNHASALQSFRRLGFSVEITSSKEVIELADLIVLPGVGAFPSAMVKIRQRRLDISLQVRSDRKLPILGICLGMQLLFTSSVEKQKCSGLDLIEGNVVPLGVCCRHIGWNKVIINKNIPYLKGYDSREFYFNHSFTVETPKVYQIATTTHTVDIPAIVRRNNIVGVQFHPEKSQDSGRKFLVDLMKELDLA